LRYRVVRRSGIGKESNWGMIEMRVLDTIADIYAAYDDRENEEKYRRKVELVRGA